MICLLALAAMDWKLVWSDEFNTPGPPDPAKWTFERGFVRNRELQWYQADNARIENGVLVVEGRRQRVMNPAYQKGSEDWKKNREFAEYTASALETRGTQDWLYGRFEVRARIDTSPGMWPAIWFLGHGPWPGNGEIDLMESYQYTVLANAAWGVGRGTWSTTKTPLKEFNDKDPDWGRKFHLWRMDWDADWIKLYLDGRLMNQVDLKKTVNPDGINPFHQPHFILLNLAIGSTGGDPSKTTFPRRFEVDYVRVYQRQDRTEKGER